VDIRVFYQLDSFCVLWFRRNRAALLFRAVVENQINKTLLNLFSRFTTGYPFSYLVRHNDFLVSQF
jgi:hypothetical protein